MRQALAILENKWSKTKFRYLDDFQTYLTLRFAGLAHEQGHALFLDHDQRLLKAETIAYGTSNEVAWDIRHVVLIALSHGARYVVVAHNHPDDNSQPSEQDVKHLEWCERVLRPLGIDVLDSYVVTTRAITSIRTHRDRLEETRRMIEQAKLDLQRKERGAKIIAGRAAKKAAR